MFYELRKIFFDFFKSKGHIFVPSSSLLPSDPSVLLTTAGMQQFKRYYSGDLDAMSDFGSLRVTSIQKCFRTSDIEEVGDSTHLTLFEMMGNFSFSPIKEDNPNNNDNNGGYFKRSAIVWAWEFITKVLNIDPKKVFVTIFEGDNITGRDEDSFRIWKDEIKLSEEKIKNGGREDNFWGPTGDSGPCGPTSEIYVADSEEDALKGKGVEIWNLVFNEYNAHLNNDGKLEYEETKTPGIDTGMGFERLLSVLENKNDVFQTSSFEKIVEAVKRHSKNADERSVRILSDHIRSSVFLISDGVEPSNKEVGYILRRLLRIVIGIKIKNGIDTKIFEDVCLVLSNQYGGIYEKLKDTDKIIKIWQSEFVRFQDVISKGIAKLNRYESISGKDAFYLYETFGLPLDLIKEFAKKGSLQESLDLDFEKEFDKHKDVSRAGAYKKFGGHGVNAGSDSKEKLSKEDLDKVVRMHTATHLLQWALRKILGNEVKQMGSDISSERLRFDFSFDRRLSDNEIEKVQAIINEEIKKDLPVYCKEMDKDDAVKQGALAFFKEKYPKISKVYFIGSEETGGIVSKELCGGPHISHTSEIGEFKILKQESVGKGIKRIRGTVA